jgi:hypothetical protein
MLKIEPRHVERAIGFLAALATFCFLQIAWDYRSSHCKPQHQGAANAPANEQKIGTPPEPQSHGSDQKAGKHQKAELSFACGVLGFPAAVVALMDDHEGFFVGAFTFLLFISTTLLWRSTSDLYRAGERQIGVARDAADAAKASAEIVPKLERPYMYIFGPYKLAYVNEGFFAVGVKYTVANYGRMPATIEGIYGGFSVGKEQPSDELEDAATFWRMQRPIYAPDREQEFTALLPEDLDHEVVGAGLTQELCPTLKDGEQLFFRIVVKYRGPFSGGHMTSACWVLNDLNNRLGHFGFQKYNYEK